MAEGTRGSDSDEAGGSDSDDDGGIGELGGGSDLNPMDSLLKKDIWLRCFTLDSVDIRAAFTSGLDIVGGRSLRIAVPRFCQ